MKQKLTKTIALSSLLVAGMALATTHTVSADDDTSKSSVINITTEKTNLNVTVPTTIDFTFKSDGTNILPTLPVVNHSIADIKLLNISLDNSQAATPDKWTIADYTTFNKNIGVNTYQLGLQAHMGETTQAFSATNNHLSTATFNKVIPVANDISTGTTQNITFDVKHGAFTNIVNAEKAFDVTFSFDFA